MKKILLSFIILLNLQTSAQNADINIIKIQSNTFPKIRLIFQASHKNQEYINDLKPDMLNVAIDGKKADSLNLSAITSTDAGLDIMLCVDLSGSMFGKPLDELKTALLDFISNVNPKDKIGIIGFADDATLFSEFSSDKNALAEKVKGLKVSGTKTSLYYAMNKSLDKLIESSDNNLDVLLVLGDGKNESSSPYTLDDVINKANENQIPVYTIGYSMVERSYLQIFERLSEKTGGIFYNSENISDFSGLYKKVNNQIHSIYLIDIVSNQIPGDGKKHNLIISLSGKYQSEPVSKEFIVPVVEDDSIPSELLIIAGVSVVFVTLITLFFFRSAKRKKEIEKQNKLKEEEEKKRKEEIEQKKLELLENEIKKRENLEKKIDEIQKQKDDTAGVRKPEAGIESIDSEKTIIMHGTGAKPFTKIKMEILLGQLSGKTFLITKDGATIGKADDNDIVLKDGTVSKHHAKIFFDNGFHIQDLGSSNGTYINANLITRTQIQHGDTFKIGTNEGHLFFY